MKTGSGGRPWIQVDRPKPPRIRDEERYWSDPPPEPSERCLYWVRQIDRGWLPNRRIGGIGYHGAAVWFGVYLWEYLNVLAPLIGERRSKAA